MDMSRLYAYGRGRGLLVAVAAVITVAVGCYVLVGGLNEDDPPSTPPDHPAVRVPEARDERAMLAAPRRIDPCALIEPAAARVPPFGSGHFIEPAGPHQCSIVRYGNRSADVGVTLGTVLDRAERFTARSTTIAGANAYVSDFDGCELNIPVSSARAIEIYASVYNHRPCRIAEAVAEIAVEGLEDVASVRSDSPSTRWDACTVLRRAIGDDLGRRFLEPDEHFGLDRCGLTRYPSRLAPAASYPSTPPVNLQLSYGPDFGSVSFPPQRQVYIGGKPAFVHSRDPCDVRWTQGPSTQPYGVGDYTSWNVQIEAPTCEEARKLAHSVAAVLDGPAPPTCGSPGRRNRRLSAACTPRGGGGR